MKDYYWLNKNARTFLERGYLIGDTTPEERIRQIAEHAEQRLGIQGFADKFEGDPESAENVETEFVFVVEGYLYKQTLNSKLIKLVNVDFYEESNFNTDSNTYSIVVDENTI